MPLQSKMAKMEMNMAIMNDRLLNMEMEQTQLKKEVEHLRANYPHKNTVVFDVARELHERQLRRKNILIFNIDKCTSTDNKLRIERDEEAVKDILKEIPVTTQSVKTVRIGRKNLNLIDLDR